MSAVSCFQIGRLEAGKPVALAGNGDFGIRLLRSCIYDTKQIMTDDPKTVKAILITPAQMRAARGLLNWSQGRLAAEAAMSEPTVKRYETGLTKVSGEAVQAFRKALEGGGVEFIPENGRGAGVCLRKSAQTASELTKQIDAIGKELAETDHDAPVSPAKGMQQLEDAHKADKAVKLKNKRAKIEK